MRIFDKSGSHVGYVRKGGGSSCDSDGAATVFLFGLFLVVLCVLYFCRYIFLEYFWFCTIFAGVLISLALLFSDPTKKGLDLWSGSTAWCGSLALVVIVVLVIGGMFNSCAPENQQTRTKTQLQTYQQQQPRQAQGYQQKVNICFIQANVGHITIVVKDRSDLTIQTFQSYQPAGRSCLSFDRSWFNPAVTGRIDISNSYRTTVIGRGLTALYGADQAHATVDACLSESCLPHKRHKHG